MSNGIEIQVDALKDFVEEVSGQVTAAESLILAWNSGDAAPDAVDVLFRSFHNIKGTAGMFGLAVVNEVFHNAESILGIYREKKIRPDDDVVAALLETLDEFKKITAHAIENGAEPADKPYSLLARLVEQRKRAISGTGAMANDESTIKKDAKKAEADESVRMSAEKAGELVEIVSDFIQLQNRLETSLGHDNAAAGVRNDIRLFHLASKTFYSRFVSRPFSPCSAVSNVSLPLRVATPERNSACKSRAARPSSIAASSTCSATLSCT